MNKNQSTWGASTLVLAALAVVAPPVEAHQQSNGNVIVEWNQLLQSSLTGPPFPQTRNYAILHIAMADAVMAIEEQYRPFHARTWAPRGASSEAAAAQAGHDVLVSLVPTPAAKTAADALLASRLAQIPPGRRAAGANVGARVAAKILAWRENDGYATANPQPPTLLESTLPGIWRPTASGPFVFSDIGNVVPFGLLTPTQFLPAPFPQLESPEYAEDLNEVKAVGRASGGSIAPARTDEQTRSAQLWAAAPGPFANVTNPFRIWSNVARDLSQKKSLSLVRTARLFAMMSASIHDSLQTSQHSKSVYRLWRPETAIALADQDNNPATEAEPGWTPLILTPAYPAYSSNMTCIGAGAARVLANILGSDAQTFTATWYSATGAVVAALPFTSLWALGDDEANSRIWGGIHYRFDIDESQVSCPQVADYLFDNYMRPLRH
jgi:hypothetical protein